MNRTFCKSRIFHIFFIFIVISEKQASTSTISGVVKNIRTGEPIVGANIYNKSFDLGTTSDSDGKFFFERPKNKEFRILISHIAYKDLEIVISDKKNIQILMQDIFLQLDDVVVTGTKCEYAISDAPVASEIINNKQIKESGAMSLSELLSNNLGMSMNYDVHGPLDYNLQGLGSKYILVLRDGSPIAGKFRDKIDLDHILLSSVNRIEIVKGPGSAIYGSDAMGGVINIITDKGLVKNDLSFNYRMTWSDRGQSKFDNSDLGDFYALKFGRKINNLILQSSFSQSGLTNYNIDDPYDHKIINQKNIDIGIEWTSPKRINVLNLDFHYFKQNDDNNNYVTSDILVSNDVTIMSRNESSLRLLTNIRDNLLIKNVFSSSNYSREFEQQGLDSTFDMYNISKEKILDYEFNLNLNLPAHTLTAGYQINRPFHESYRIADSSKTLFFQGLFFQDNYIISDNLNILIGIRRDTYDKALVHSPRIALVRKFNGNFTIRGSYGKGYRAPSVSERFMDFHNVSQGYKVKGNANLLPEKSTGMSCNISYTNLKNMKMDVTFYHNNFKNKIYSDRVLDNDDNSTTFQYNNISSAQFSGVEIFSSHVINSSTTFKSNLNFRQNIDEYGNSLGDSIPLSFGMTVKRRSNLLDSDFLITYLVNKRDITNSYIKKLDIVAGKSINQYLELKFAVKNITNETDKYYGPFLGRSIFLEVVLNQNQ